MPTVITPCGGSGGGGDLTLLYQTFVSTPVASITYSGIDQTGSTLLVTASLRSTLAITGDFLSIRFNGVTTTEYYFITMQAQGTLTTAVTTFGATSGRFGRFPGSLAPTGYFNALSMTLPHYNSGGPISWTGPSYWPFDNTGTGQIIETIGGLFQNAANVAVTSLTLFPASGGNFATGSQVSVYLLA